MFDSSVVFTSTVPQWNKVPTVCTPTNVCTCLTSIVVTSIRPQQLLTSGLFSIVSSQPNINVSIKSGIHTQQDPGISFMSGTHQPSTAAHSARPQPYLAVMSCAAPQLPINQTNMSVSCLAPTLTLISCLALTETFIYFMSGFYQCPLCRSATGPPYLYHIWYRHLLILPTISQTLVSTT